MKTLEDYKGYHGIDASNEESLFEYGLLVKYNEDGDDYHCIYKYGEQFSGGYISEEEVNQIIDQSWFNRKGFFSSVSYGPHEWREQKFVTKLHDLIQYYGAENIMGTSYHTFDIRRPE